MLLHVFVARLPNVASEVVITLNQPLEQGQVVSDRSVSDSDTHASPWVRPKLKQGGAILDLDPKP